MESKQETEGGGGEEVGGVEGGAETGGTERLQDGKRAKKVGD